MSHNHRTVRVAKNYLCAHIYQFVNEEQAALEHLLMDEHRPACLRCYHEEHRDEVGSKSRPRCIGKSHYRTVDERIDHIMRLARNNEVIAVGDNLHSQSAECVRDDAEIAKRHVLDADAVANHRRHADDPSC